MVRRSQLAVGGCVIFESSRLCHYLELRLVHSVYVEEFGKLGSNLGVLSSVSMGRF